MRVEFWFRANQRDEINRPGTMMGTIFADTVAGKIKSCDFATPVRPMPKEYYDGQCEQAKADIRVNVKAIEIYLFGVLDREPTPTEVKDEYLRRKKAKKQKKNPPKVLPIKEPLVCDILTQYLERAKIKESTKESYSSLVRSIVSILGKECTASAMKESHISQVYEQLATPESNGRAINAVILLKTAFKKMRYDNADLRHFELETQRQKDLVFLEKEEVELIWNERQHLTGVERQLIDYFIFMCETAVSLCDFLKLTEKNVIQYNGRYFLNGHRQKTNVEYFVPISERAEEIGAEYRWNFPLNVHASSFRLFLKNLMKKLKIDKRITLHKARHTKAMQILDETGDKAYAAATLGNSVKMIEKHYAKLRISGYAKIADKYRKK